MIFSPDHLTCRRKKHFHEGAFQIPTNVSVPPLTPKPPAPSATVLFLALRGVRPTRTTRNPYHPQRGGATTSTGRSGTTMPMAKHGGWLHRHPVALARSQPRKPGTRRAHAGPVGIHRMRGVQLFGVCHPLSIPIFAASPSQKNHFRINDDEL